MSTKAITKADREELAKATPEQVEQVLVKGNLGELNTEGRVAYYNLVCQSMGMNPLTRPFEFITLNSKVVLYAKRDATDQLRKIHGVSISSLEKQKVDDLLIVTATATDSTGRTDSSTGVVSVSGLKGEALANAMMKAETKAKRRVTLSLCGLGVLDETEIVDARDVDLDETPHVVVQPSRTSEVKPARAPESKQIALEGGKPVASEQIWPKDGSGGNGNGHAPVIVRYVESDGQVKPSRSERRGNGNGHAPVTVISQDQRKRLYAIVNEHGYTNTQFKAVLEELWGFKSSTEISVDKYEEIVRYVESDGQVKPGYQATNEDVPW